MQVQIFSRTPEQMDALRQVCRNWQRSENFWTFDETLNTLIRHHSFGVYIKAETEGPLQFAGFAFVTVAVDEAELIYVYVDPHSRRQKFGETLLMELQRLLKEKAVRRIFLEVRPSNKAAIRLYEKVGFAEISRRTGYYRDGEDAIVYRWNA